MTSFSLLLFVISLTLAFEFSNGWHDAANSIATVVSTRVLTPFRAVAWAAFWNFVAAFFFGTAVAGTIGKGMVHIELVNQQVRLSGLLGAIIWNLITLILGLPTSSSHALIGGFGGAAVAKAGLRALIFSGWIKPVAFIFLSPLIGMLLGMTVTIITSWIVRRQRPLKVDKWFRRLQLVSAAGYRRRNHLSTFSGRCRRTIQLVMMVTVMPKSMPISGERKIKATGLIQPLKMSARRPAFATAAPPKPPIRACDELVGRPRISVIRFQIIAPSKPDRRTCWFTISM